MFPFSIHDVSLLSIVIFVLLFFEYLERSIEKCVLLDKMMHPVTTIDEFENVKDELSNVRSPLMRVSDDIILIELLSRNE